MLVTLPGPGGSSQGGQVIIDVEVLPASATSATEANDLHPGEPSKIEDAPTSTSALPDAPDSAAGESEVPGVIVELVAKHAMAVSQVVEDAVDMRRQRRPCEGVDQGAWLSFQLGADPVGRCERFALELHLARSCLGP
jgi:hypothetical protein